MLITLSSRAAICQSVVEVYLNGVAPLGAVSHMFNLNYWRYTNSDKTSDMICLNELI